MSSALDPFSCLCSRAFAKDDFGGREILRDRCVHEIPEMVWDRRNALRQLLRPSFIRHQKNRVKFINPMMPIGKTDAGVRLTLHDPFERDRCKCSIWNVEPAATHNRLRRVVRLS